jgi:hypothetical protein
MLKKRYVYNGPNGLNHLGWFLSREEASAYAESVGFSEEEMSTIQEDNDDRNALWS